MKTEVLDKLEQKARRAAETLSSLREENDRLTRALGNARTMDDSGAESRERLEERMSVLQEERDAVRERVEELITLLEEAL